MQKTYVVVEKICRKICRKNMQKKYAEQYAIVKKYAVIVKYEKIMREKNAEKNMQWLKSYFHLVWPLLF